MKNTLIKIKVLYWHIWFYEETLTSMDPFYYTHRKKKHFFKLLKCYLHLERWFTEMFFLGDQNMTKPIGTFIFKSVLKSLWIKNSYIPELGI